MTGISRFFLFAVPLCDIAPYTGSVSDLRLLPLLSSATEIVHALGLGEFQVGRSHECDFPAAVAQLPVCTRPTIAVGGSSADIDRLVKDKVAAALSVYTLDGELIESLQPTHILTQTQCKVCAVSLEDVERDFQSRSRSNAKVISLEPYALNDVWQDIRRVAAACERAAAGEELITRLQSRMHALAARARAARSRPRIAAIEWQEPLMAAGNWVPELIELADGQNLFGLAGQHSPWMTFEQLEAAEADVIAVLPCGFDIARTRQEMYWLTGRAGWHELPAVRSGRVFLCDGNQFMNRPGPRLVESLQIFSEILHPERFAPELEGYGWEHFG